MGKALYRKHRSKSFDELVGQSHITSTLKNAIKNGNISHAYLFTGPRGTGKTSVARILAHSVNDLDYMDESSAQHIDIIEIDAASNRRIDEIRDLRDKVNIAPTSSKYKVYIIDEVHMLTKEAFNALLKTLEEPPDHVIFILATTEAHKLPETIISRTQRFTFKPISNTDAVEHLRSIAKQENIDIEDSALQVIAEHGRGSFRDSISILDQLGTNRDKITKQSVLEALGIPPDEIVNSIVLSLQNGDTKQLLARLNEMREQGIEPQTLASAISTKLRLDLHESSSKLDSEQALRLIAELLDVTKSSSPNIALELALIRPMLAKNAQSALPENKQVPQTKEIKTEEPKAKPTINNPVADTETKATDVTGVKDSLWKSVLIELRGKHNTLYGIARMAEPNLDNSVLTLSFKFDFHKRRCSEKRNKDIIQNILNEVSEKPLEIVFSTKKTAKPVDIEPAKPVASGTLDSITDVFGGGEVI